MDVGNPLFVTSVCCLSLFLKLENEEKEFVSVLRLSIDYYPYKKHSITHLSNSYDSKTCFISFQSFLANLNYKSSTR